VLGALSEEEFEQRVAEARGAAARVVRRVVNAAAIEQKREGYRARINQGGTVEDLVRLAARGFRASVICADPPWSFDVYSGKGKQRSAERYFDTMALDEIGALPVAPLAAKDCALFLWGLWPQQEAALEVVRAWGFEPKTAAFVWVKTTANAEVIRPDGNGLHWGMGYSTRSNTEFCLLATKGSPLRLSEDVHQVIIAPVVQHSKKPEEFARRIERLYPGPYLELFARCERKGWLTWGNEIAPPLDDNL
jgi:N6-adenosine-specific RNA methylase IME4